MNHHYFYVETFNFRFVQVSRSEFISLLRRSRKFKTLFPYKLELETSFGMTSHYFCISR